MEHIINNQSEKYILLPKDRKELEHMIREEIDKQGPEADLNHIDVSDITDFSSLFKGSEFNGDISRWDVSNATNMEWMFYCAYNFNGDISDWDVSNVTNMSRMFYEAKSFNQDLSGWDVSKVTDMGWMFCNSNFNGDVSSVTDMNYMFYNASKFNQDLSEWDVSNVTAMSHMFDGCPCTEEHQPKFK